MIRLVPHPQSPPSQVSSVTVRWFQPGNGALLIRWLVEGVDALLVPPFAGSGRANDLWKKTCFELFLKDREGEGYAEYNFSPTNLWAAYRFDRYREGMRQADMPFDPVMSHDGGANLFVFNATIRANLLEGSGLAGLSAVIEEKDGTKSYWAIAHPAEKPDFHDPACFGLPLPAPVSA